MDKKILHNLLTSLTPSTTIDIAFLHDKQLSGSYKVLESKAGRGKGGSRVVKLLNLTSGETLDSLTVNGKTKSIGTPTSDAILNITVNGTQFGNASESELPVTYPKDQMIALQLKKVMHELSKKEGTKIVVSSTEEEFTGTWTVKSGKLNPGRYGQVSLELEGEGKSVTLWSYRHSGIIKSIAPVSE